MNVKIISAGRGIGKTTFLRRYLSHLATRGRAAGGVISPAVFDGDRRIGYDMIDIRSGTQRELARIAVPGSARPDVGPYSFDKDAVAAGNASIISALRDKLDIVAIDEVGPLEFRGAGWAPALNVALRECLAEVQLIVVIRESLLNDLPESFPSPVWRSATVVSPPSPTAP